MTKVVSLWGDPTGEPTVQPDLVQELERLLELANAGQIVGGSFAVAYCDGCASASSVGQLGGYSIIGALEAQKLRLIELARGEE